MKGKSRKPPSRGKRHDTPKIMMHPRAGGGGVSVTAPLALKRETELVIKEGEKALAKTPKLVAKQEKGRA